MMRLLEVVKIKNCVTSEVYATDEDEEIIDEIERVSMKINVFHNEMKE